MKILKSLLTLILFSAAFIFSSSPLFANSEHATKEEAQAMATKAADFLKEEGPDKAFKAFNAGGDWRMVISMCLSSTTLGHGEPAERGQS